MAGVDTSGPRGLPEWNEKSRRLRARLFDRVLGVTSTERLGTYLMQYTLTCCAQVHSKGLLYGVSAHP